MIAGLTPTPDPSFDRFARLVRDALGIPVALVSVVEPGRQVFPGAVGLAEPWASERQTPLSHSFCQYVVADEAALIVSDARKDPRLKDNGAVTDLGVVAYVGFPLRTPDGAVIGSVCAIDREPRDWTETELRMLHEIAGMCSTELELRDSRDAEARAAQFAQDLSARARLLLSLSEQLADTATTAEIAEALRDAAAKNLDCNQGGIWLLDGAARLQYLEHPSQRWPQAECHGSFAFDATNPIGAALARREPLFYRDRAAQDDEFPALAAPPQPGDGEARAIVPLTVGEQLLGTLTLLWPQPREFSMDDRISIAALASYTSQAVSRALLLAERTSAAATLQHALLSDLPQPDHLDLIARYRPAAAHDEVGGDWYDAVIMPSGATALVIGDVTGHDIAAAAAMGSLRNLLRAFAWAIDDLPSANIARLDRAARDLGIRTHATLVFARIEQTEQQERDGVRVLRWTNAGHPPPILVHGDGSCVVLDDGAGADCMLGVVPDRARRDQTAGIPAGATLLLYTDGLVETRDADFDHGHGRLVDAVSRHHGLPIGEMVDAVLDDMVGEATGDDVAVLAVRFNAESATQSQT